MTHSAFKLNRKALFGLMVLAAAGAMPAQAATLVASPVAPDGVVGDTLCSLREAVMSVNAGADFGDCVADVTAPYGASDTITMPAGTYDLTVTGLDEGYVASTGAEPWEETNTPDASIGDLDIMKSVRIVGAGAGTTIIQWGSGVLDADRDRIFHVYTTALAAVVDVPISDVTIQGGRTFQTFLGYGPDNLGSPIVAPTEYYLRRAGGGLAVGAAANVVVIDPGVTGVDNSTGRGGSQRPDEPDEGGATFSLTLTGVKVLNNQAAGDGAGIYTGSPMTATNIVVSGNTSTVNGGGIYNEGDTSITNSTISGNTAEGGGGIFLTGSNTVTITGTTLSGNSAVGGGGISGRAGMTLNMVNSTISGNSAQDVGAGLYSNGSVVLNFVTIAKNVAGSDSATQGSGINMFPASTTTNTLTMKNVLLADNVAGSDPLAQFSANCGTTGGGIPVTSSGNNLSSDASCDAWLVAATDLKSVDPKIVDLADNGGPTLTHALLAGSPALSAGASDAAVKTDQRGAPRESPPDIGAFELDNITESTSDGGGCTVGGEGRLDPTLPAMLAAALAFFGLRRRAGK